MTNVVTLSLRTALESRLEVQGVAADRFAGLAGIEIATLPVWLGARPARLGDFFDVRGGRSARVRIEGSVGCVDGLAAGTAGGELLIDGDAGHGLAAGMSGGRVEVRGNVGDDAGVAMAGGELRVAGSAGHRLGAAVPGASKGMVGGEIIVGGSARDDAAARARRGLVVIGGDVGRDAARAMIAGTLVVFGRTGVAAGRGSKRGSIVAVGGIDVPPTYRYACTFRPPHVRLMMTHLRRHYGVDVDERVLDGRYRRYCGDAGDPGKGEILEWVAD